MTRLTMSPRFVIMLATTLSLLGLVGACGDDEGKEPDACGRFWQRCEWDPATQTYARNCTYTPPPADAGSNCADLAILPASSDAR